MLAKFNGNHPLMANVFKLQEHQTFGLMKCIIWAKSDLAIISSIYERVWFTISKQLKILLFNFYLFYFSKFQMTIVKNLMGKPSFLIMVFQGCESCTEMYFVSLFLLNERNIATSLLMIHLKCIVVHYADLNSSSLNKLFLNYGSSNMPFYFFDFLF